MNGNLRILSRFCAVLTAGIGTAALLGWFLDPRVSVLFNWGGIPMAPSTATLFILYGAVVVLRTGDPSRHCPFRAGLIITAIGSVVALLLLILSAQGIHSDREHLGIPIANAPGDVPMVGHMSPVTAACFLLASSSILLSWWSSPKRPWLATAAWWLAGLLIAASLALVLAYLYGDPLLYGGSFIPPAAPTSIAFLALGIALLALASSATQTLLLTKTEKSASHSFILVFVLLACGIVTAGYLYYRYYEVRFRGETEHQLSTIAGLKSDGLVLWRNERLGDASVLYGNRNVSEMVRTCLEPPGNGKAQEMLRTWLRHIQEGYRYDRIFLLDAGGRERLSVPEAGRPLSRHTIEIAAEARRSKRTIVEDFSQNEFDRSAYLAVHVPILPEQGTGNALATIVLRIDPGQYLYPFLLHWPLPSRTGETLIVRREGDGILYLSELRFQKRAALNLRMPLDRKQLPEVQAVLGKTGILRGLDYRDVPVIADVRPVPDSPWFLVSRIDTSEVYAPLREKLWLIVVLVGALLTGAGVSIVMVWKRQLAEFYRERYITSEALLTSETQYKDLFRNMVEGVSRCRMIFEDGKPADYLYLTVNEAFEKLTGLKDVVGKRATEVIPGIRETDPGLFDIYGRVSLTGAPERFETYVQALKMWFSISVYSPQKEHFVALFDVITERKRAEAELRESESKFRSLAEQSLAGTYILQDGLFRYVNPRFSEMFGYAPEEIFDRLGPLDLVLPEDRHLLENALDQWTQSGKPMVSYEARGLKKTGAVVYAEVFGSPAYYRGRKAIVGIVLDVTEKKKLEHQLLQSQKMEAVGQLTGGIAHDFNNILLAITGYASLLRRRLNHDDPLIDYADQILASSKRAANLTQSLLTFSRKQITTFIPVEVNDIIGQIRLLLQRIIGEDIDLRIELCSDKLVVKADAGQLEQVLMNLAANARDAMLSGGVLTLRTAIADATAVGDASLAGNRRYALITVIDTGVGMSETVRDKIFEPFFTTKESGRGTGLGLSMVYGIVQQHGGCIQCDSEPGAGTTFRIYLPLCVGTDIVCAVPAPVESGTHRGGETILVAEDDPAARRLLKIMLESDGYRVLEAADGDEAVARYREHRDRIQLVLCDVVMPRKNGAEVQEAISRESPDARFLFMSGYPADIANKLNILKEGVEFLAKPLDPMMLLQKIRDALHRA